MNDYTKHFSVLKKECLDFLCENPDQRLEPSYFADLTFGAGGHSFEFLYRNKNFNVFSTDQDPDALLNGQKRIIDEHMENRITLIDSNFVHFPKIHREKNLPLLDGILLDLGVSSHHFDSGERGFSFRFDAPLDMRMNYHSREFHTAEYIVNNYREEQLVHIFEEYGEERFSKRIAQKIVETRRTHPIRTTIELENLVFHCYPKEMRHGKTNPSTKIFQALRVEVNKELEVLTDVLSQLIPLLKMGGRLAVISFHSLEDRIVKNIFRDFSQSESLPVSLLTKKPVLPTEDEILLNKRSRSAKLRVVERIEAKKEKNKYKII